MFLEQQISIYFWRSCDTEYWSNGAENSALITEINYILTYIQTQNSYFTFEYYFRMFLFLLYIWSNICSLGEQKLLVIYKYTYFLKLNMIVLLFRADWR